MFVIIIHFPPIKKGKDAEFLEWFAWSNREFGTQPGSLSLSLSLSLCLYIYIYI